MSDTSSWKFETKQIHSGAAPDPVTNARATPIYQTTSYVFNDAEHAKNLFALAEFGNIYTRLMNPTTDVVEQRVAALEGGTAALAVASGSSAVTYSVLNIAGAGDHIVSSSSIYGGTYNLFKYTLAKLGIEVTFVENQDDEAEWAAAVRPNTKLFFAETIGNPKINILDIEKVAGIAHENNLPLIVDNTIATPYLIRPFEFGADIVVHSATKFLGGHGTVIGGVLVDSGAFDWSRAHRFPELNQPYAGFHGMVFSEESTVGAFLLRARREGLRDFGACMSPHTAWLILQGIETLPLRMARHVENTRKVVAFLAAHSMVAGVGYPELDGHPGQALARRLLPRGCGAVFSFDLKGSRKQGQALIEALKIFSHLANVGDCRSLVIHPASTTHFRMDDAALRAAGITAGTIRLSIGLEDADDLIDDLKRAFKMAEKAA